MLQYHQNMQEKIADEMIKMAQNLKHTSVMASNIIKEDNKVNSLVVYFDYPCQISRFLDFVGSNGETS